MYGVSDAYKTAMHQAVQRFRLTGTVGTTEFTDENILSGSFSITNQCSGNNEIQIGQVYVGELDATFLNLSLTRYSLKGMQIMPSFGLMLSDGTYEDVPLGVFNISEASWTMSGLVVKAYDNISLLDKSCSVSSSEGTPYELAKLACDTCGLILGNTEEEFEAFANGTETLSLYSENDIETWRDYLSWLSQAVGCNVTAGRDGSILFRPYGVEIVDIIDEEHRFAGGSFSDFETRYTGLSCVNMADSMLNYYGLETDDALTYNLGSNPFLQYGLEEKKTEIRTAVLNAVSVIDYVPFKVTLIGNPAYDLMDVFSFSGGIADADKLFCMTKYTFNYNRDYQMEGVGKNPALASARSKTDKNLIGLLNQVETSKFEVATYANASELNIGSSLTRIIGIVFAAVEQTNVIFAANVHCTVTAEDKTESLTGTGNIEVATAESIIAKAVARAAGDEEPEIVYETKDVSTDVAVTSKLDPTATFTYKIDDDWLSGYEPAQVLHDGDNVIPLLYPFSNTEANTSKQIEVYMKLDSGTAVIAEAHCRAVVAGSGIAGGEIAWDGKIVIEEYVAVYGISGSMLMNALSGTPEIFMMDETFHDFGDSMSMIKIAGNVTFIGLSDVSGTDLS